MRGALLLLAVMAAPSAAYASEGSTWFDRCLADWQPGAKLEHKDDSTDVAYCMQAATITCRFADDPTSCLDGLDANVTARIDAARQSLPDTVEGEEFEDISLRRYLEFTQMVAGSEPTETLIDATIRRSFAWIEETRRAHFERQFELAVVLLFAQARVEEWRASK